MLKRKLFATILLALLIISLALSACGSSYKVVMEIPGKNGVKLTSNIYKFYLSYYKSHILYSNFYSLEDYPDLWAFENTDDNGVTTGTYGDIYTNLIIDVMKQELAIQYMFNEAGLTVTKEMNNEIDVYVKDLIKEYYGNSKNKFNTTLARFGINDKILREIELMRLKRNMYADYLYNVDTGVKFDQVKEVYQNNYVRIKHILISTMSDEVDDEGNEIPFTDEQLEEKRLFAEELLARIEAGEALEDLLEHSDDGMETNYPNGYVFSQKDNYVEEFREAAFDMEIDEVRIVETEYGYHIMKKYPLLNSTLTASSSEVRETIISDLLVEEATPYVDMIVLHEDELSAFNIAGADTMADCTELLS